MMTLPIGAKRATAANRGGRGAFTLLELILVMALLLIVMAVAAPSLSNFFRGRILNSEARRLLSLTRYGQSRAVSEGVPMVLWLDTANGRYGLNMAEGYTDGETNALEYEMGPTINVECFAPAILSQTDPWSRTAGASGSANISLIRLLPDGYISENSPESILLVEGGREAIWIAKNLNHRQYEISTNQPSLALR